MTTIISITLPSDNMQKNMLISSLSFIHPMVIVRTGIDSVELKLFECSTKEELDNRLTHLAEASSVDFCYKYSFVK